MSQRQRYMYEEVLVNADRLTVSVFRERRHAVVGEVHVTIRPLYWFETYPTIDKHYKGVRLPHTFQTTYTEVTPSLLVYLKLLLDLQHDPIWMQHLRQSMPRIPLYEYDDDSEDEKQVTSPIPRPPPRQQQSAQRPTYVPPSFNDDDDDFDVDLLSEPF